MVHKCKYQGKVYAGKQISLRNLTPEKHQKVWSSFEKELSILEKLKHPNIVELRGYSKDPNVQYSITLYMDLYHGSLFSALQERSKQKLYFSQEEMIPISHGILEGLSYLHSNRIAHRDLKAENVLVR